MSTSTGVSALAEGVGRRLGLDGLGTRATSSARPGSTTWARSPSPSRSSTKPGPLDAEEMAFVRRHTLIGARILLAAPALAPVAHLVRASHERWDGAGYPDGLAGEQIPLGARIIFACDAFEAMTSGERPYRAPGLGRARPEELRRCAGTQFDPRVVEALGEVVSGAGDRAGTPCPPACFPTTVCRCRRGDRQAESAPRTTSTRASLGGGPPGDARPDGGDRRRCLALPEWPGAAGATGMGPARGAGAQRPGQPDRRRAAGRSRALRGVEHGRAERVHALRRDPARSLDASRVELDAARARRGPRALRAGHRPAHPGPRPRRELPSGGGPGRVLPAALPRPGVARGHQGPGSRQPRGRGQTGRRRDRP